MPVIDLRVRCAGLDGDNFLGKWYYFLRGKLRTAGIIAPGQRSEATRCQIATYMPK